MGDPVRDQKSKHSHNEVVAMTAFRVVPWLAFLVGEPGVIVLGRPTTMKYAPLSFHSRSARGLRARHPSAHRPVTRVCSKDNLTASLLGPTGHPQYAVVKLPCNLIIMQLKVGCGGWI